MKTLFSTMLILLIGCSSGDRSYCIKRKVDFKKKTFIIDKEIRVINEYEISDCGIIDSITLHRFDKPEITFCFQGYHDLFENISNPNCENNTITFIYSEMKIFDRCDTFDISLTDIEEGVVTVEKENIVSKYYLEEN